MAVEVILPRVDMDMEEAKISRWLVEDGATVKRGDGLFEIETSKAAMEIEAGADGIVQLRPEGAAGNTVRIGAVVALILKPGETRPEAPSAVKLAPAAEQQQPVEPVAATRCEPDVPVARAATSGAELARATPLARRLARQAGIDLGSIQGSGPRGRVIGEDVERFRGDGRSASPAIGTARSATGLHVRRSGRKGGATLVFLHGFGSESEAWRPAWTLLGTSHDLIAIDLPGHGKSGQDCDPTMAALADAVAHTIRSEAPGPVHLAGHSLGGAVAARLAARGLADIASLLLIAPAGLGPETDGAFFEGFLKARQTASLQPWLERLFADPTRVTEGMMRAVLDQHADPARLGFRTRLAAALFPDGTQSPELRARLGGLRMPARLVWGRRDAIIPWRHALEAPAEVGVHLLPGCGHMPHVEDAGTVVRIQLELIESAGSR